MGLPDHIAKAVFLQADSARLPSASVAWSNTTWMARHLPGVHPEQRNAWLLENFAYELAEADALPTGPPFSIDRYGATGFKRYGGSGRAGVIRGFQVKGLGPTILRDPNADWAHAHGRMFLREALAEATFSVRAARVFPAGAVETVAVLRTGGKIPDHEGVLRDTALLIRPFALRACHLQRALGYQLDAAHSLAHLEDVERVKVLISWALEASPDIFVDFARSAGEQAARSHLLGWFGGGFYSSNLCLDGRLIDFGAATFAPSWRRVQYSALGPCFGDEMLYLGAVIDTLCFYASKYHIGPSIAAADLLSEARAAYERRLLVDLAELCETSCDFGTKPGVAVLQIFKTAFALAQGANNDFDASQIESQCVRKVSNSLGRADPGPDARWRDLMTGPWLTREKVDAALTNADVLGDENIRVVVDGLTANR